MPDLPINSVITKSMLSSGLIPFIVIIGTTLLLIIIAIILVNKEIRR